MYKLNFELVPDGCWYSNLRSILPKNVWMAISKDVREQAGNKCSICGNDSRRLDAHERWSYDEKNCIQKLEDVICVCSRCHSVIHIGYTQIKGNIRLAEEHFMKVNACSYSEFRVALGKANEEHKRRNLISEWKLDLTWLKRYMNF